MTTVLPSRAWTITIHSPAEPAGLVCSACVSPVSTAGANRVRDVRRHLARHVLEYEVPAHLRTCQCRERTCVWHRRQVACSGPLCLLLIRADQGRTWHLADVCAACAAVTPQAARVREPQERSQGDPRVPTPAGGDSLEDPAEWVEL